MWTRTSTCRQNGYGFTAPYPYEVTAGGAAAGELLRGVTGSRQILLLVNRSRGGKGLTTGLPAQEYTPPYARTPDPHAAALSANGLPPPTLSHSHPHTSKQNNHAPSTRKGCRKQPSVRA